MKSARMVRTLAAAGAVTLVALAFVPTATATAPTQLSYTSDAVASAVHFSIDVNPSLVPISDLIDVRVPQSESQFTSAGIATGTASLFSPGNAIEGLSLVCSAAAQAETLCEALNNITSKTPLGPYPPNNPLSAKASYPQDNGKPVDALVSGKQLGSTPLFSLYPGEATAQATASEVKASAAGLSAKLLGSTPIGVSTGTMTATTHDYLSKGSIVSIARSHVSDVSIAGVIHIGAVTSTARVTNDGRGHVVRHGSTTVTGVTALGQPATIDNKGISIGGAGDHGVVVKALNATLHTALAAAGITIELTSIDKTKVQGQYAVNANGLLVTFARSVKGLPNLSQYLPCIPDKQDCLLAPPNLNAKYTGITALGSASATAYAKPIKPFHQPPVPSATPSPPSSTASTAPGTIGGGGGPLPPGGVTASPLPAGSSPVVAGQPTSVNAGDLLTGVSHRLKYLFPAFLLAVLAAFGGALFRYPARLPVPDRQ